MIVAKIEDAAISKDEFDLLPFLDRRLYEQTAKDRFSLLDTHLTPNHPDFNLRLEANAHLRTTIDVYVRENKEYLERQDKIKVIELGASLGAISSLYLMDSLHNVGLAHKVELTLLDICRQPLERTKRVDFDLHGICRRANFGIPAETLRKILQNARIAEGNVLETQQSDNNYTISLAPFTHHHLNIYDKKIACDELERITSERGGIIVGDLTFSYGKFVEWLKEHKAERNSQGERVSYAVESFVSLEQHQDFFSNSSPVFARRFPEHYVFAMRKGVENV